MWKITQRLPYPIEHQHITPPLGTADDSALARSAAADDSPLTYALNLGWRIAHLYALADDFEAGVGDTLLPLHHSLAPGDQLELQLRAAAGDARRAEIPERAAALDALAPLALAAAESTEHREEFRSQLRCCHIAIDKELWARREADGKAYELGNGLSDTYNRIYRAYRDEAIDTEGEWRAVFAEQRIERLKTHLHDLQSRLDARGVTVVSDHLDAWRRRVEGDRRSGGFRVPSRAATRVLLRRQTTIWRQLLAGDKEPEAYLDRQQRARIRGELARMVWRRYLRFLPALAVVVGGLVVGGAYSSEIVAWYNDSPFTASATTLLASLTGALGITQASVGLTVRTRAREWTELLWNRALTKRVTDVTLLVDKLLPVRSSARVVEAGIEAGRRARARAAAVRKRNRGARRQGSPAAS